MRTWVDAATLAKTKCLKGRFVAKVAADLPFFLEEGMQVAFVPPRTDVPRTATVQTIAHVGNGHCEVQFAGIDESIASELVGCHCLVRRADMEEALRRNGASSPLAEIRGNDGEGSGAYSIDGWAVFLLDGSPLGTVDGFIENTAQTLMKVTRADRAEPTLIPVVEEFIVSVDDDSKTVTVDVPQGLLEL